MLSALGAGGMGEVYRAKDTRLARDVALKVLPEELFEDEERVARFVREARLLAALNHPAIATIHAFEEISGRHLLVTELLEGQTLRGALSGDPLPPRTVREWAGQIAEGLAAAHEKGIVHRDLKPENLFVTRHGQVKILDFGLARRTEGSTGDDTVSPTLARETDPGTVLGTAGYMSPEQVRGQMADHRSDIFSFGAVLCEMLTGRRAFQGASAAEAMAAILRDEPAPPVHDGGPVDELWALAEHCLQKDPARRFQSTSDLAFALRPREGSHSGAAAARASEPAAASIAVLPFRNMSPSPDAEYFSDGITEEIINALMKIDALRVAARTSSFAFKGKAEDVRGIGERLGVRTVLEGSVRQAGGKLRVTAQLINVANGYQLWSERYDRSLEDVFAVQDEISRAIASTLEVRLLGPESGSASRAEPDPGAYDLFLKGRWYFNQRSASKAVMEFDAAVAKDSSFAPAYTGLADSYGIYAFYGGIDTRVAYAKARAAAGKARALAPDSAEVHLSLGILEHYFGWDFEKAERELRLAIARNPRWGPPYYWLGLLCDLRGRPEEGLPLARRAAELEPLSPAAVAAPGWGFYQTGRVDEALREFRRGLELDPNGVYPLFCVGVACQHMGAHSEAIAAFEKLVTVTGGSQSHSLGLLGGGYAAAGRKNEAERILGNLRERSAGEYVAPLHMSFVEIPLGDFDAAFASLTRACEERNANAWWWICHDPALAHFREDPRFPALRALVVPG